MTYVLPFPENKIPKGGEFGNTILYDGSKRANPHRGVDFSLPAGTPIKSATDGKVVLNKESDILGWVVVVECTKGLTWGYCHLREPGLRVGAKVVAGETVIGKVGNTGSASRGAHLHFTCGGKDPNSVFYGWVQDPVACIERLAAKEKPAKVAPKPVEVAESTEEAPKAAPVAKPVAKKVVKK